MSQGCIHPIFNARSTWNNFHTGIQKAKKIWEANQYPPQFYENIVGETFDKLLCPTRAARVITLKTFFEGITLKKQSSSELITTILLTHFLWELQQHALKAYPDESQDMNDYLVLQGLLEGIHQSKTRLEMHKAIEEIHAVHSHALNLKS